MREATVIKKAREILEKEGCIVVKTHGNAYFPIGFPDLIIIRPDGITAFVEAKASGEQPDSIQLEWLKNIRKQGCPAGWSDWPGGIVEIALDKK
jgi:Holliday junction resolvase-like predicted endonuclease